LYKIPASTLFFGKTLVFVPECHSTNSLASDLASKKTAEGTLVITANQTAGRGQRGNTWLVEPGKNFTLSIVLYPKFLTANDQFLLHQFVSLSLTDYLQNYFGQEVKIKWPNDILIHAKKVCGILIENQLSGVQVTQSIIGIGLNVNQTQFEIATAASMAALANRDFDLSIELEKLLSCLEKRYMQLKQMKKEGMQKAYLERMHWRNELHVFSSHNEKFQGMIRGISENGRLQIEVDKTIRTFDLKEVSYLN
jgi:BirA family biotin operon repressor/biotin-[acetyl-CoA-carboxylase] ligase